MNVATTSVGTVIGAIKSVSPVNSEQSDHGECDAYTESCRPLEVERIDVRYVGPRIPGF